MAKDIPASLQGPFFVRFRSFQVTACVCRSNHSASRLRSFPNALISLPYLIRICQELFYCVTTIYYKTVADGPGDDFAEEGIDC